MIRLLALLMLLQTATPKPWAVKLPANCSDATPTPHIHMTEGGDISAKCPDGWAVHRTQKAVDDFNKIREPWAAINMLADATCVKKSGSK